MLISTICSFVSRRSDGVSVSCSNRGAARRSISWHILKTPTTTSSCSGHRVDEIQAVTAVGPR